MFLSLIEPIEYFLLFDCKKRYISFVPLTSFDSVNVLAHWERICQANTFKTY